jgi:hypothetical protein
MFLWIRIICLYVQREYRMVQKNTGRQTALLLHCKSFNSCFARVLPNNTVKCGSPALYSGGPGFKSHCRDKLYMLSLSWSSSVSPGKFWGHASNYAITAFFYILFNLEFVNHPVIACYIDQATERVVKIS